MKLVEVPQRLLAALSDRLRIGSFVLNNNCTGAGYYYRVDTAYAKQFINTFLD